MQRRIHVMSANYESYKIFYYVAYYGNITLAAKALYLTQPTVSHAIINLENELNCKLFIRSKAGVTLSPEGEVLFKHVSKACKELLLGEKHLKALLDSEKKLITIGTSETVLKSFLIRILGQFKAQNPDTFFRIYTPDNHAVYEQVKDGSFDLGIVVEPLARTDLESRRLTDFSMTCIAGPKLAYLNDHPITYSEICRHPIICLAPGTASRIYLDHLFLEHQVHLQPDIELASSDLITPLVEENIGIGFVPRVFADKAIKKKRVVELNFASSLPTRSICLLTDPEHQPSVICQKFMTELQKLPQQVPLS